jgi:hypothetical protein
MTNRDLSYMAWRSRRSASRARTARLNAGLPPFERLRLRGPDEAAFLRRVGTPEALIGPVGSDAEVALERQALVRFARRIRMRRQLNS